MSTVVCAYCEGPHEWDECDIIFTPIIGCEFKAKEDGTCMHDENMTPECHDVACPRLDQRMLIRRKSIQSPESSKIK